MKNAGNKEDGISKGEERERRALRRPKAQGSESEGGSTPGSQGRQEVAAALTPGASHPLVPRSCELPKTQLTSCYPKAQNNPETQTMLRISFLSEDALTATCEGGVPRRRADTSQGVKSLE